MSGVVVAWFGGCHGRGAIVVAGRSSLGVDSIWWTWVCMLWLRAQCVMIGCVSCLWRLLKRWIGGVMLHDGDAVGCTWKGYGV